MADRFFGYGSLVNRATQRYPGAVTARLDGWRRVWVHLPGRPYAVLSVRRAFGAIDGLLAEVPGGDWAALDIREVLYRRHPVTVGTMAAQVYAVPDPGIVAGPHPILLSYLDVVLQGYLREFGIAGAAGFITTTDGWNTSVLNDRADPIYPRAQRLEAAERNWVDAAVAGLRCRMRER